MPAPTAPAKPAPAQTPAVEDTLPPTAKQPRFSPEGLLLNPEDCMISAEGVVTAKS